MKQSFICISVKELARTLAQDRPIQSLLKNGSFAEADCLKLAQLLQERTINSAVIPESIEVVASTEANKRVLDTIKGLPKGYVDHLNSTLKIQRVKILGHNPQAVQSVREGTDAYRNLITLWRNVEAAFDDIGPSRLGITPLSFCENYLIHCLPLIRSGRAAKFNITLLLDETVRQGTLISLRQQLDIRTNPDADILKQMVAEFLRLTKRTVDPVSNSSEMMVKFLKAQKMIRELGKSEPRKFLEENALNWVRAQCFYYREHFDTEHNIQVEVGYQCGAEAVNRFTDFLANLQQVKEEKPVATKGVKLHQIGRKFGQ